jgi:hypothetical protein
MYATALWKAGTDFAPAVIKRLLRWQSRQANPVTTSVDLEPLIQAASALEDERFEQGFSDCEGLGVSTRLPSPLTECETDAEPELSDHREDLPANQPPWSVEKKRCSSSTKNRCAKKRAKTAASGHQPHAYAANPSTINHHVKESDAIHAAIDAGGFSASGSGSWVGKRKDGVKKAPWTVPELLHAGFEVIEWDGR